MQHPIGCLSLQNKKKNLMQLPIGTFMCGSRGGGWGRSQDFPSPLENNRWNQDIGLFNNTGTDPTREAIGPFGSNCFMREVRTALCKIR